MAGMKSGAGDDPFADVANDVHQKDADDEQDDENENGDEEQKMDLVADEDSTRHGSHEESATSVEPTTQYAAGDDGAGTAGSRSTGDEQSSETGRFTVDELPYIARRNVRGDSVKTGRDKNILFELRPEIAAREDEFVEELERRLETDVPKTDAREAALAAIWDRPELVVPILEKWGLGYFDD